MSNELFPRGGLSAPAEGGSERKRVLKVENLLGTHVDKRQRARRRRPGLLLMRVCVCVFVCPPDLCVCMCVGGGGN